MSLFRQQFLCKSFGYLAAQLTSHSVSSKNLIFLDEYKNLNYNSKLKLLHSLPNVRLTGLGGWLSKTRVQVSCADSHTRQVFRKTTLERTELKTLCSASAQDTLLWTS